MGRDSREKLRGDAPRPVEADDGRGRLQKVGGHHQSHLSPKSEHGGEPFEKAREKLDLERWVAEHRGDARECYIENAAGDDFASGRRARASRELGIDLHPDGADVRGNSAKHPTRPAGRLKHQVVCTQVREGCSEERPRGPDRSEELVEGFAAKRKVRRCGRGKPSEGKFEGEHVLRMGRGSGQGYAGAVTGSREQGRVRYSTWPGRHRARPGRP